MPSLTEQRYREKTYLWSQTEKDSSLFCAEVREFLIRHPLPQMRFSPFNVSQLWDDIRQSEGYATVRRDHAPELLEDDDARWNATYSLLNGHGPELNIIYPIEITSRLIRWYSIFKPPKLDYKDCYEPSQEEYQHFFTLRGDIDRARGLAGGHDFYFYFSVRRLFQKQAQVARAKSIRLILSDPTSCDHLKTNTYVVPADLQFIISTYQVYTAHAKALIEGKTLPLPEPRERKHLVAPASP